MRISSPKILDGGQVTRSALAYTLSFKVVSQLTHTQKKKDHLESN